MTDKESEILHQAIARNVGALLSLPSAGMLRHYKSRFLTESEEGITIEAPSNEGPLIADLIATGQPASLSFKQGLKKTIFAAPILQVLDGHELNGETKIDAILIGWPEELKSVQRRSDYRVDIIADYEITIRVWRIGDLALCKDQPPAAAEVKAVLRNLSTGGVGVRLLGRDNEPPKISTDDRLRIQITGRNQTLVLEGRMRGPSNTTPDNSIMTGIQFKKIQEDLEGRKVQTILTRLVGELQREELRRMRLGMSKVG